MNGFNFISRRQNRFALLALLGCASLSGNAHAADILVTTAADSGAGSLRSALAAAADDDRIVFNISETPTIRLLSDLPDVSASVSFVNNNAIDVTIDRNGNGPLTFVGAQVDPTILVVNTAGAPSANADIVSAATTSTLSRTAAAPATPYAAS